MSSQHDVPARALPPAARAFDAVAARFDERFGGWMSVAAQRRAVRRELLRAFAPGARVLEIGGGTGEDASFLADAGRAVLLTDPSPSMVAVASQKISGRAAPASARVWAAEQMPALAAERAAAGEPPLDGAFSNFAALNCVADLRPVAAGLARMLRPGAPALLVLFGPLPPGEVLVEAIRGDRRAAFRRLARGDVPARLGGRAFTVRYHRPRAVRAAFAPWFRPVRTRGIGVFVPPSAAEPWISRHPRLLAALEALDRIAEVPLALLGDHVLYHLVRTDVPCDAAESIDFADVSHSEETESAARGKACHSEGGAARPLNGLDPVAPAEESIPPARVGRVSRDRTPALSAQEAG